METPCHYSHPEKGDPSCVTNYRPISLLSSVSKVLEKIVFDHVSDYIYPFLSDKQFGFIPNRSCLQQFLSTFSIIFHNYSSHNQSDIVYLDFSKAFDSIPHFELLKKLNNIGISGNLYSWFCSYLSYRTQSVSINGTFSSQLPVTSGVPQGSILGPLLFILFVNDLPDSITSSSPFLFADDTKCVMTISSPQDSSLLQDDLNALANWSSAWKLAFNTSKCKLLRISPPNHTISTTSYSINQPTIDLTPSYRDLGVLVSDDLRWNDHYSTIIAKAYKSMYYIRRSTSNSHSTHTKLSLYKSLVRPKLLYCSQVWRPHLMKDIRLFESVQRRATKFILQDYHSSYKDRLITLHLLPLSSWFEYLDITFLLKCLQFPPDHFINIFDYVQFVLNSTRSASASKLKCTLPKSSINRVHFFYFNRVVRLWNSLPVINLSLSTSTIKNMLKNFLWTHFINSFDSSSTCTWFFCCPCNQCTTSNTSSNFASFSSQ